ncbi:MAG: PKD domain-containing protein, partial [Blastocatellia bacterium]
VTVLVAPDITPIPLRLKRITASKTGPSVNFGLKFKSAYAPLQVFMDFGDGSSYSGMATSEIKHSYSGPGSYSVKVTVLDVFGQSVSASKHVEIE